MAVILNFAFGVQEVITPVVMTATDTAVVDLAKKTTLIVVNDTGGSLTINVKGDTATSATCAGIGEIDLTGGIDITVADGETYKLPLNAEFQKWLGDGNLTLTNGTGAEAYILEI